MRNSSRTHGGDKERRMYKLRVVLLGLVCKIMNSLDIFFRYFFGCMTTRNLNMHKEQPECVCLMANSDKFPRDVADSFSRDALVSKFRNTPIKAVERLRHQDSVFRNDTQMPPNISDFNFVLIPDFP